MPTRETTARKPEEVIFKLDEMKYFYGLEIDEKKWEEFMNRVYDVLEGRERYAEVTEGTIKVSVERTEEGYRITVEAPEETLEEMEEEEEELAEEIEEELEEEE